VDFSSSAGVRVHRQRCGAPPTARPSHTARIVAEGRASATGLTGLAIDAAIDSYRLSLRAGNKTPATMKTLSLVVPEFHGHVLNYTGDGFIAYFAEPSFTTKNDLAIDCVLTWREQLQEADPGPTWPYKDENGDPYLLWRVGRDPGAGPRVVPPGP